MSKPPQAKRHDGSPNCTCTIVASSDLIVAPGYASLHKLTKSHLPAPKQSGFVAKNLANQNYISERLESNWIENYVCKLYVLDIVIMYVQIMYRNLYVFVLTSMLCDFGFAKFAHAA